MSDSKPVWDGVLAFAPDSLQARAFDVLHDAR